MNIRKLSDLNKEDIAAKRFIVRMDLDVPGTDYSRIEGSVPTLSYLIENGALLSLIGHKGRPGGKIDSEFSLQSLTEIIGKLLNEKVVFAKNFEDTQKLISEKVILFENLRFDPGEEENSSDFAKKLSLLGNIYVNEAFATSHRAHASFVGITKHIPGYAGFRLSEEVEKLSKVIESPKRPLTFIISGIKEDKIEMIKKATKVADYVLVGGKLPFYIERLEGSDTLANNPKVIAAHLNPDGEDITINSIEKFESIINESKTVVLAGVIGKYEDPNQIFGTKKVFEAVSKSSAYKIAGGGDTEGVLTKLGLTGKFDWISVGGGAMLEFLVGNKLPGIEALKK